MSGASHFEKFRKLIWLENVCHKWDDSVKDIIGAKKTEKNVLIFIKKY